MLNYFCVALGGAIGSVVRYWCSEIMARYFGNAFPIGTLFVNVTGSLFIGLIVAFAAPEGRPLIGLAARNLFVAGFCGGYTTFSALSLQTLMLAKNGELLAALANVVLNVVLSLLAVWAGYSAAMFFVAQPGRD
jgi:fluoride exporter